MIAVSATTKSINITVGGGTTPYTFLWSNAATTQNISGLAAGIYTVTVTDAHNCTALVIDTITQPNAALTIASDSITNVDCFGNADGAVSVTITGGTSPYSYHWNVAGTTSTINGLVAGTYHVTVTDAHNCTVAGNFTVTQPNAPLVIASDTITNVSCFGGAGAVGITVTGGTTAYSYHWSNGGTGATINGLAAGTYAVTVTDAHGCTVGGSFTVAQPSNSLQISADSITNVDCFGNADGAVSITVIGGTTPYVFHWSNGATTQNISGLVANSYSVTVTDAHNCQFTASYNVTQPSAPLTISNDTITNVDCFGNATGAISITVAGGTTAYSYHWNTGASTSSISGLVAGNYGVTVTDAHNCKVNGSFTVTQPTGALAISNDTITNVDCFGNATGAITVTASGGTTPYSYNWNTGATTATISGLIAGTYTVTITDANNCTVNNTGGAYTVTQPNAALTIASDTITNVDCFGNHSGIVSITVTGGTTNYTYHWSNGATTAINSGLIAGTYGVTVTDAHNCKTTGSYTVTQPTGSLAIAGDTITNVDCFGNADGAITVTATGGTPPYSYNWNTGAFYCHYQWSDRW